MSADRSKCTLVNPLCPDDLCVLPFGHWGSGRGLHLLGTMPGSAQKVLDELGSVETARQYAQEVWEGMWLASQGQTQAELAELGYREARRRWPDQWPDHLREDRK